MREKKNPRPDFSDIDNLHRATESFLKEQHRLLAGRRPVRAPRNFPVFTAKLRGIAVSAAAGVLVLTGVALAAGNRHSTDDQIIVPKIEETQLIAEQTAPPAAETTSAAAATVPAEETVTTASRTRRTRTTQTTSQTLAADITTDSAETTQTHGNSSRGSAPSATQTVKTASPPQQIEIHTEVQQINQPSVTQPPVYTTAAPPVVPQSTAPTTHTTTHTTTTPRTTTTTRTTTTPRTTTTTRTTTRTTTTTTRTTTRTTTTTTRTTTTTTTTTPKPTTTTTTTTTVPPRAELMLMTSYMHDWDYFENTTQVTQKLTLSLRNIGNAAVDRNKSFIFTLPVDVRHVGCLSGNSEPYTLCYSGNKIYFTLNDMTQPQDYVEIELSVLADRAFFSYTVEFES